MFLSSFNVAVKERGPEIRTFKYAYINKNKKLHFNNYKVKCAIGKRGIGVKRKEGDLITPKGLYKINKILYRKDRIKNLRSKIKTLK